MDAQSRQVTDTIDPQFVIEGAGVRLKRSIATPRLDYLDPFLLLDHFGSDDPNDYLAGFPLHPHRGIETVTYMLAGVVAHKDSLGNAGTIGAGDVQWMTAGSGILHEEMPKPKDGKMEGFQLWVNLPAKLKMTPPRYQGILAAQIPEIRRGDGAKIRVIAGQVDSVRGPVTEIAADPTYLDITLPANASFSHPIARGHTAFAYVFEGAGTFGADHKVASAPKLLVLGDADVLPVRTAAQPVRFLLVSGKPLHEPISRYGPFVMNTRAEIEQALRDLRDGTFVKD
ncbi:MAG: pirin family protein [Chloroflexota bacterium]|nr:pirin family protein [Chloroflexota bacterium]